MQDAQRAGVHGIILAGVHQWDAAAFDAAIPRTLLPVAQRPLIAYALQWLREAGLTRATICANSASPVARRCLGAGESFGMQLDYYEDQTPRGPAGCLRDAAEGLGAEELVVADGTIIPQTSVAELLATHRAADAAVTVAVAEAHVGGGRHLRPVGLYVFSRRALECVPRLGYQDVKEVLIPKLHRMGERVVAHNVERICPRVVDFNSYLAVSEWAIERSAAGDGGRPAIGQGGVHPSACVAHGARLIGPVLVGPGSVIVKNAVVVGPTAIGADCVVEAGAVVSRSVLWDRCMVGANAALDRCVLAHNARVAADERIHDVFLRPPRRRGSVFAFFQGQARSA